MITEATLKSEKTIRIFHRIAVQNFPSFKRVSPVPCDAWFGHSICETGFRYYDTVSSWKAERMDGTLRCEVHTSDIGESRSDGDDDLPDLRIGLHITMSFDDVR